MRPIRHPYENPTAPFQTAHDQRSDRGLVWKNTAFQARRINDYTIIALSRRHKNEDEEDDD